MNFLSPKLTLFLVLCFSGVVSASEPMVVIVNKDIQQTLSAEQMKHVFLGRSVTIGRKSLKSVIMHPDSELHTQFSRQLLNRSAAQLNAYWSKLLFTGKGSVPKVVDNTESIKRIIASNKYYVGYIPLADIDDRFRVVFEF